MAVGRAMCALRSEFDPHNVAFVVLGTFILWFGWYGFNCGSTLAMNEDAGRLAAQVRAPQPACNAFLGILHTFPV